MYSKLKLLGHPIHPMLVAFPIAFYTASLVSFLVYAIWGDPFWFRVGLAANIAGVGTALLAAVPGFLDWLLGIPSTNPAKGVGLIHMILNLSALGLFALNAWLLWDQWDVPVPDLRWALVLAGLGVAATIAAGYFGFTLIQKHHIGIDPIPDQQTYEPGYGPVKSGGPVYRRP
jgi:uncharacterized membrane protein